MTDVQYPCESESFNITERALLNTVSIKGWRCNKYFYLLETLINAIDE
jgi:hypothetical protein